MQDWFEQLKTAIERDGQAVMVTVIAVGGSVPREVGATMVVSVSGSAGTIGGGNLEYTCISHAGEMLGGHAVRDCKQILLGPALGQCCGGRVEVLIDLVKANSDWYVELTTGQRGCRNRMLCRALDSPDTELLTCDESGDLTNTAQLLTRDDRRRWFHLPLQTVKPAVWVYGAGHVGQAVISQLSLMQCQITLLDHREEWLYLQPSLKVCKVLTDDPVEDALNAPVDAVHVVMTHSHTVDFNICHSLLKTGQFGWLGLIGSDTKRQTFENRLRQRGISDEAIKSLRCPIGTLKIESSKPALIALNLAAELALHWQKLHQDTATSAHSCTGNG